ncbi:Tap42 interacting protein [Sporothrix curviconia]|uniref:Tap42 interacting protein n=1 Tax=Sporothrix curviconia TaxID=1260050 RepID=A0ABP0CGP6_9PEZI
MASPARNNISSVNEPFLSAADLAQATRTHVQGQWEISSRKLPISRAAAIDELTERITIPVPEMIFGDNQVAIRHRPSGWAIWFDAGDALDQVDKTGQGRLQVAYASDWASSREMSSVEGISDVRPYDWSYTTPYKGTELVVGGQEGESRSTASATAMAAPAADAEASTKSTKAAPAVNGILPPPPPPSASASSSPLRLTPTTAITSLPLDLLRRRDPIVFNDDVILYESELDDNGISVLRVKIRAMPQRLLLLSRFYLRLDNVLVRVRDTRVYVDFETNEVLREYTAREDSFENVRRTLAQRRGLRADGIMAALRDANQVADLLPVVESTMERLDLSRFSRRT